MGNTCYNEDSAATLGEVNVTASSRPLKKAMAGNESDYDAGLTIRGIGVNEAVHLQAALRGYLARRMLANAPPPFEPTRDDIKELHFEEVPQELQDHLLSLVEAIGDIPKPFNGGEVELGPVQFKDGSIYVGEWSKSSLRSGFGVLYWPDGIRVYKGSWEDDLPTGDGMLVNEDQSIYKGHFKRGKPNGRGALSTSLRGRYEGDWKDGKKHGKGKELFPDSSTYEGDYVDDAMEGNGIFCWDENRSYSGCWKRGERHGVGIMKWADGKFYEGSWKNGKQHGEGLLTEKGVTKRGEWNRGRRTKWVD